MDVHRIVDAELIGPRSLKITFSNQLIRELDFSEMLTGLLKSIDSDEAFAEVAVDHQTGTIFWPGGIDLDPEVLAGVATPETGPAPRLISK